jgi:hypothetical protein
MGQVEIESKGKGGAGMNPLKIPGILFCAISLLIGSGNPLHAAERQFSIPSGGAPVLKLDCKVSKSSTTTEPLTTPVGTLKGKTTTEVRLIAGNASTATIRAGTIFNYKIHSTSKLYNQYGAPQGTAPKTETGSYRLKKDLAPGRGEVFLTRTYSQMSLDQVPNNCEAAIPDGRTRAQ